MEKMVAVTILFLVSINMFGGIMTASVLGDENYNDNSNEISNHPAKPFDEGMAREELHRRIKDV
jgi:hypothetical protein